MRGTDTDSGKPSLAVRYRLGEHGHRGQYEDFPDDLQYLQQPYCAMNQQPWWDLPTSGMYMSTSHTATDKQEWPSALGCTTERPLPPDQDPGSTQAWLDSAIVTPFATFSGRPGSQVIISFQLHGDVTNLSKLLFFIMFADHSSPAALATPRHRTSHMDYMLTARIPAVTEYGLATDIPLSIIAEDSTGRTLFHRDIGHYIYNDGADLFSHSATLGSARKRRASDGSSDDTLALWKRSKLQSPFAETPMAAEGHGYQPSAPLLCYPTPQEGNPADNFYTPIQRRSYFTSDSHFRSPFHPRQQLPQNEATPLTRSVSHGAYPAYATLYPSPATTMSRSSSQRMIINSSPALSTPSIVQPSPIHSRQLRNGPWPNLSSPSTQITTHTTARPTLVINGDLDNMLDDWSEQELVSKRRLVVFERSQVGSTVTISFEAVTPEDRAPGSACVSCIWWEQRQGGYVTSVDTIALAESLCGYKFNVPVKNRIRRNLEGYKPTTVAKDKQESEEFFKVVMGFPAPKPRNIEKHIKVFPWKCLSRALRKIVGKYVSSPFPSEQQTPTCKQGPMSSSTTQASGEHGHSDLHHPQGHIAGRVSGKYLNPNLSPASASSYEVSVAGSSGQPASRTSESPYFSAAHPAHLEDGKTSTDQVPAEFQSGDFAALPEEGFHDYHHYWRQQDESSDAAHYQWAMQSSYDPGLTATPTTSTDETAAGFTAFASLPAQLQASPGMFVPAYRGSGQHAFHGRLPSGM